MEANRAEAFADPSYQGYWTDEDLEDAARMTGRLIEERFGPEPGNYD